MWQVFFTMLSEKKYQGLTIHKFLNISVYLKKSQIVRYAFIRSFFVISSLLLSRLYFKLNGKVYRYLS